MPKQLIRVCDNMHDKCSEMSGASCPYCCYLYPYRYTDGKFAPIKAVFKISASELKEEGI